MSKPDFTHPHALDDAQVAFPASVMALMPAYDSIPDEFSRDSNPYARFQAEWFFSGLKKAPKAKPGIDQRAAMRHLSAIQCSFEPKHEHKAAAVAYLASLWLELP